MSALTRRDSRGRFPDLFECFEPSQVMLHPFAGPSIRTEDYVENGRFVVRAEVPGINPDNEAEVTVAKGILTIHAERHEENESARHSEFRYGSFTRHVVLPATADESDITASYDKGIIEVSVGLRAADGGQGERRVPVQLVQHIRPT